MSSKLDNLPSLFIDNDDDLVTFCHEIKDAKYIAVDTEFVRDKTYYAKLCLIQVASPDAIACIDPFKLNDLKPLKELFDNPQQTKIFHAARQDLEILYADSGSMPMPLFDTQVAATLLGMGEQIGYANLVNSYLKVTLAKQHARTDWEQRPLTDEQLEYAANDVRYLIQIYPLMLDELDQHERRDWLKDDFAELTNPALYEVTPSELWQRVSGNQKLRRKQLAVLQELCIWREQLAMDRNKPRKWILADNIILSIAMSAPSSEKKLANIRGINPATLQHNSEAILSAVQKALDKPESEWPSPNKKRQLTKNQEATVDALMSIAKLKAMQHSISVGAIVNRNELEKLIIGEQDLSIQTGWRHNLIGQYLENFLQNDISLSYSNGELSLTAE